MKIKIYKGIGNGPTQMAAFDSALINAGVANFNLIYLSSVIPTGCEVEVESDKIQVKGEWGDRLYVVIAQKRVAIRNKEAWAGIGWIQDPETKKGLLVEHEGHSESEVREDIKASLSALAQNRNTQFSESDMMIIGTKCKDAPVCALVVAVFQSRSWSKN